MNLEEGRRSCSESSGESSYLGNEEKGKKVCNKHRGWKRETLVSRIPVSLTKTSPSVLEFSESLISLHCAALLSFLFISSNIIIMSSSQGQLLPEDSTWHTEFSLIPENLVRFWPGWWDLRGFAQPSIKTLEKYQIKFWKSIWWKYGRGKLQQQPNGSKWSP